MPSRKNSIGQIKSRRAGALYRLENPSADLKAKIKTKTPEQLTSHNDRVKGEISVLKKRIGRVE